MLYYRATNHPDNLARFTGPITMQSNNSRGYCGQRHHQHSQLHAHTGLALPLVSVPLSGAGAPRLSAPQQLGA
jgi:hypothetical protein